MQTAAGQQHKTTKWKTSGFQLLIIRKRDNPTQKVEKQKQTEEKNPSQELIQHSRASTTQKPIQKPHRKLQHHPTPCKNSLWKANCKKRAPHARQSTKLQLEKLGSGNLEQLQRLNPSERQNFGERRSDEEECEGGGDNAVCSSCSDGGGQGGELQTERAVSPPFHFRSLVTTQEPPCSRRNRRMKTALSSWMTHRLLGGSGGY